MSKIIEGIRVMIKDLTKQKTKKGFTLVEILVVMSILAIMVTATIGILDPIALVGRARDSKRKRDLNDIKTSFEEFFNDKGRYPTSSELSSWNQPANCGKSLVGIKKYLRTWPCGLDKKNYRITVSDNWFKAVVNLENKKDKDIPKDWYKDGSYPGSNFLKSEVNYGVSSSNVLWYEGNVSSDCDDSLCFVDACNWAPISIGCNVIRDGKQCYLYNNASGSCSDVGCARSCCGAGCSW